MASRLRLGLLVLTLCGAFGATAGFAKPTMTGTAGDDQLRGTPAGDGVTALGGDDSVHGFGGPDGVAGGFGKDFIDGGGGGDYLNGGGGSDTVHGGKGDDVLEESTDGRAIDRLDGGPGGADVCIGDATDRASAGCEAVGRWARSRKPGLAVKCERGCKLLARFDD
jgi:Ca2+-binding RTX toxin-like protein